MKRPFAPKSLLFICALLVGLVPAISPADTVTETETSKIEHPDGVASDYFGGALAVDGNTIAIAAGANVLYNDDDPTGSVYVFTGEGPAWSLQQKLKAPDGVYYNEFGASIALDGDTLLIGAPLGDQEFGFWAGAVYVFTRSGTTWTLQAKLRSPEIMIGDEQSFGEAVALDGDTAVISVRKLHAHTGAAYIFARSGTIWTYQDRITAPITYDVPEGDDVQVMAMSVALDGGTALISSRYLIYPQSPDPFPPFPSSAATAYAYTRVGTTWTQQGTLLELVDETGNAPVVPVALSGDTALIGVQGADDVYGGWLFSRSEGVWSMQARLLDPEGTNGAFGSSVALRGDTAVIGKPNEWLLVDNSYYVLIGSAYVFSRSGTIWTEQSKLMQSERVYNSGFGVIVGFDGNTVLIGAPYEKSMAGSVYLFGPDASAASVWLGLKNSDDQGTQFDLRAEIYRNGTLVSAGETRCITGLTRNAGLAKPVAISPAPLAGYVEGEALSLKLLTRIGTNPDGSKCPGPGGSHSNAVGLRLYYDATSRASALTIGTGASPAGSYYLHSTGASLILNGIAPTASSAKYRDSPGVNFAAGNAWKEIGVWGVTAP